MARITFQIDKGNLGAPPEISFLKDNTCMARLSIAVNRFRKDDDGEWEQVGETSWINGVAFGYPAELIESMELDKGDSVFVQGSMEASIWEDEDGEERKGWDFRIDRLYPVPRVEFEEEEDEKPRRKSKGRSSKRSSSKRSSSKRSSSRKSKGRSTRKSSSKRSSKKSGQTYAEKVLSQLQKD